MPIDLATARIASLSHHAELTSTMDEAHRLGELGATAGTVVVADRQRVGRGRNGKRWTSEAGAGLYLTLLERAVAPAALGVLSLRVGLALADLLTPWCTGRVGLKWPNDLLVRAAAERPLAKLSGILVEARWRDGLPEWVAIGVGVNLWSATTSSAPDPAVSALRPGVSRATVLTALVPRLRAAAAASDQLTDAELAEWRGRDVMVGQRVRSPGRGVVEGINAGGALLVSAKPEDVRTGSTHALRAYRSGSLIIEEEGFAC